MVSFFIVLNFYNLGKEARKKELKKNKKQRQMVRAAVLKGKDPHQIISELERIDQMGKSLLLILLLDSMPFCLLHCFFGCLF